MSPQSTCLQASEKTFRTDSKPFLVPTVQFLSHFSTEKIKDSTNNKIDFPTCCLKVKVGPRGWVDDISQDDENRFVCGCGGKCLVVCELPSGRVLHRTNLPGSVKGVCVFPESSSEVGVLSRSDELLEEIVELRCIVEAKEREVKELQGALRDTSQALEEKEREKVELSRANEAKKREVEELQGALRHASQALEEKAIENQELSRANDRVLDEKERQAEGLHRTIQEQNRILQQKEREKNEAQVVIEQKETEIIGIQSSNESLQKQLDGDRLSGRTREFLRYLDLQRVSTLDLSERYRHEGCIGFREHILNSSEFSLAQQTADGRFAFRDVWFSGPQGMEVVPFDTLNVNEEEVPRISEVLSVVETVIVDVFADSSLAELVMDESDVTGDDILDLQEEWDEFYRTDPVYDTEKLMRACDGQEHHQKTIFEYHEVQYHHYQDPQSTNSCLPYNNNCMQNSTD